MSMEKRAVLAAVLMAVVFLAGQYLFFPPTSETPPPTKPDTKQTPGSVEPSKPAAPTKPEPVTPATTTRKNELKSTSTAPQPTARSEQARPPQRLATIVTPLYRAVVSSEGGKLQELTLQYRGEKPMVIVGELGPAGLVTGSAAHRAAVPMELSATDLKLGPDRPTGELVLRGEIEGLRVTKTLTFHADTYTIDTKIRLDNAGGSTRQATRTSSTSRSDSHLRRRPR